MATFTNTNGQAQESKVISYVLAHPETDSALAYLNIPKYLSESVVDGILASQRKLGFTVRKTDSARIDNTDISFLSA